MNIRTVFLTRNKYIYIYVVASGPQGTIITVCPYLVTRLSEPYIRTLKTVQDGVQLNNLLERYQKEKEN